MLKHVIAFSTYRTIWDEGFIKGRRTKFVVIEIPVADARVYLKELDNLEAPKPKWAKLRDVIRGALSA